MKNYFSKLSMAILIAISSNITKAALPKKIPNNKSPHLAEFVPHDYAATWSYMFFYGRMTTGTSVDVYKFRYHMDPRNTSLYSFDVAYTLARDNPLLRLVQPLVTDIELTSNVAYQNDPRGDIWQFNPYMMFRWRNFFWDRFLTTTFAIGEGLSWASKISARENEVAQDPTYPRRLLNFLAFEMTLGLPKFPEWEVMYRIHHRSGMFGVFCPGIISSNVVGIGIRYHA